MTTDEVVTIVFHSAARAISHNPDNPFGYQASFKKVWATTLRKAGIPYFRIYDLRSTYATRLSAGGWPMNGSPSSCATATRRCSRSTHR